MHLQSRLHIVPCTASRARHLLKRYSLFGNKETSLTIPAKHVPIIPCSHHVQFVCQVVLPHFYAKYGGAHSKCYSIVDSICHHHPPLACKKICRYMFRTLKHVRGPCPTYPHDSSGVGNIPSCWLHKRAKHMLCRQFSSFCERVSSSETVIIQCTYTR